MTLVKTEVFFWLEWGGLFVAVVINGFIFYISLLCSVSVQAVYEIFRIVFLKCGWLVRFFSREQRGSGEKRNLADF